MAEWAAKRFWKSTTVVEVEGGFSVLLDDRNVRTPAKAQLIVPSQAMAHSIAAEWDAQEDKIDPMTMPFTRGANAAIDKVAVQHAEVADMIAAYGESDLLCYRAEGPQELIARQAAIWDPVLEWAAREFDAKLTITSGIMPTTQPANSIANLQAQVTHQTPFELTALHDLVSISGSLVLGLAAQQKAWPIAQLWDMSRLDEEWQIEQWGRDETADAEAEIKKAAFFHALDFYNSLTK